MESVEVSKQLATKQTDSPADPTPVDIELTSPPSDDGVTKKKKKKKKSNQHNKQHNLDALCNSDFRCLNDWPVQHASTQTFPPTIPIHEVFTAGTYPAGEVAEYVGANALRITNAEKRELERAVNVDLQNLRRAAECHRQTRKYVQSFCRPGMKMIDICQRLEAKSKELIAANGFECGWAFPTGCSINNVAAHYTPNYGDDTVLQNIHVMFVQASDIMKLDFGVHVAGRIIDCAFSVAFEPKFDELIKATQDGTNTGLKTAGIDVQFSEIGTAIQEVIESYEMEAEGKVMPIRAVMNLNGHSINPYKIHGDKSVPIVRNALNTRMEEGELYAIETFATTGKGTVVETGECSHYMRNPEAGHVPLRLKSSKALLHTIDQNFGTLAFCRRWLDDLAQTRHQAALKNLVDADLVTSYPPLADIRGSFVSQMEHTIFLRPTCKEILSRGPDY